MDGVGGVLARRITATDCRRDAALGPAGGAIKAEHTTADDCHAQAAGCRQGDTQTGCAAADDNQIVLL
ncbi:MAG: hypothetical protein R3F18_08720 [Lysobacterales bacterium]